MSALVSVDGVYASPSMEVTRINSVIAPAAIHTGRGRQMRSSTAWRMPPTKSATPNAVMVCQRHGNCSLPSTGAARSHSHAL
jgi:hypothetical protein